MQRNMKIGLGLVAVAIVVAAGALVAMRLMAPSLPPTPPIQGYVRVQVINGPTKVDLTLTQLLQMNPISDTAMYQNINHNWRGYGLYEGVRLSTIIETVGTMSRYNAVRVNATDGYTQLYSYDNLYPNATFRNLQGDLILAFACNGSAPPTWPIGPRIAFLPPDGNYSNTDASQTTPNGWYPGGSAGSRWVYNVTTIELLPNVVVIDGSTKLNLALPQLVEMTPVSGNSSFQNQYGNWKNYGVYMGVNLSAIIEKVGTMGTDDVVRVNATDGIPQLYSYDNLYPNATFYNLQGYLVLAYAYNGTAPPGWDSGPRIVFLPPDKGYSNDDANKTTPAAWFPTGSSAGSRWLKWVATIELLHGAFPPSRAQSSLALIEEGNLFHGVHLPVADGGASNACGSNHGLLLSASGSAPLVCMDVVSYQWREND
jgi:DMSO/TMAO reductase YedYZ molybdopterin-dependent catalytic subunit